MPRISGIYTITCIPTGKAYVGSAVNTYRRWKSHHLPQLRRNKHCNTYLQAAWNKHGEAAFVFAVVEPVEPVLLVIREQSWLDRLQTYVCENGFNLCRVAGSTFGVGHTKAERKKIGLQHSKTYVVRSPAGVETQITNLSAFCRKRNLVSQAMVRVAKGRQRAHKGWECRNPSQKRDEWLRALNAPTPRAVTIDCGLKRCSCCHEYKPFPDFTKNKRATQGLSAYCRRCSIEKSRRAYLLRKAVLQ